MSSAIPTLLVPPRLRRSGHRRRQSLLVFAFTAPAVLLALLLFGGATVQAIAISLSDWAGAGPIEITGFGQYVEQLQSPEFYSSLGLTIGFSIACAALIISIATLLAAAVSRNVRGSRFYRVVWFIPGVAPAAAVGVFWATAFQPGFGTVNAVLGAFGQNDNTAFLADPKTAIYPVIAATVWASVGFAFILILGAMEQVPVEVYEAAKIDGASSVRQFFSITLPLARPVIAIVATLNLIGAFNNFAIIWGMTQGGPGSATTTLPILVYKAAFQFGEFGAATAIAVIAGVVLIAMGLVAQRFWGSKQEVNG
jgi:ABC-type sugar transport system permease subunit